MDTSVSDSLIAFGSEAEAIKWLLTKVLTLEGRIIQLERDLAEFNDSRALEIAQDRQRIAKLENGELRPEQKKKREILLALLDSRQGKMPSKEARQLMGLSKQTFTNLLAELRDEIEVRPFKTDKRKKLLIRK